MTNTHLVSVWNPSYTSDAMGAHLAVLLEWARLRDEERGVDDDGVYVWWGKVRSPNRQQPQTHLDEMRALDASLEVPGGRELQLYLTDYRSLWVADVVEIHEGELPRAESRHAPAYYEREKLNCDFWFKIADARRLVADDLLAVIEELKLLRNIHYNDRPVSLYGGMVDLPLFVTRPDGREFFDPFVRDAITGDRLWAQFDALEGGGTAEIERDLRENTLGEVAWAGLDPTARTFLATAERLYRDHRRDPAFDFAPVVVSLAKAMEVQTNRALMTAAAKLTVPVRSVNIDGNSVDLTRHGFLSLGELARVIGGERELNDALAKVLQNGRWFVASLPAILDDLKDYRNRAAHSAPMDVRTAGAWRERILGIGCLGDIVELAKVKPK